MKRITKKEAQRIFTKVTVYIISNNKKSRLNSFHTFSTANEIAKTTINEFKVKYYIN